MTNDAVSESLKELNEKIKNMPKPDPPKPEVNFDDISSSSDDSDDPSEDLDDVDRSYQYIISNGGNAVQEPRNMPWDQRTALFSDPDGNIHEIFVDIK